MMDQPSMMTYLRNILENIGNYPYGTLYLEYLEHYRNMPYWLWLLCLITLGFFLCSSALLYFYSYLSVLFIRAYCYFHHLRGSNNTDVLDGARNILSTVLDVVGWLWHGYEVVGLENIPEAEEGGALLIYFHGAMPLDFLYISSKIYRIKRRCIRGVLDRFFFRMHALKPLFDLLCAFTGSFEDCVKNLKEGRLVAIAPGGAREAQLRDEEYQLVWDKKIGFAKVALEAQVPIIPVFTQNLMEAFRTPKFGRKWLRNVFEKTRLPVVPIYGGFPVKLRTHIGKPIPYDPNMTAEELAAKSAQAIENLISLHQRLPGNILKGIIDRVYEKPKQKTL